MNRAWLVNSKMEGGDLSLILKNVSVEDGGTYECYVTDGEGNRSKAASILLNVTDAGESGSFITIYFIEAVC